MDPNQDPQTVQGFGSQWTRLDQSGLDPAEASALFDRYFKIFPWESLAKDACGFDLGCGSGRWAVLSAPKVGRLHLIDASPEALAVARRNLAGHANCELHLASVDRLPFPDGSMDFGYCLGVLHHVPDTASGIRSAVAKLKPGAPLLLYLYYSFDNKPDWYRGIWRMSDLGRQVISRLPNPIRYAATQAVAAIVYWPLARLALLADRLGLQTGAIPLSAYRDRSFYSMRTDALDRFGTRLEHRFSRAEIQGMMESAGLEKVRFSDSVPFWCAVGYKKAGPAPVLPRARPKLLYLVTEDWYFCSHRLPLARAALRSGFEVLVATHVDKHGEPIRQAGLKLIPVKLRRSSRLPWTEGLAVAELARLYSSERPDIVHHVAAKPVLYGSLAAEIAGVPAVVNAMAGLGFAFTSRGWRAAGLKAFLSRAYRWSLSRANSSAIFQNRDDIGLFEEAGIIDAGKSRLIRGSGVDLALFQASPEPAVEPGEGPRVVLASRLLWDKGVGEFVEAARRSRARGIQARFVLIGDPDPDNPASIPRGRLRSWSDEGIVEWQGWRDDMPSVLSQCHIVCLPSYREGLPKVLLEAAACGRPLIATDVPGCREIVRHDENGLLVPARDPEALAGALARLIKEPETRRRFGSASRRIAETEFSVDRVIEQTLDLYRERLAALGKPL